MRARYPDHESYVDRDGIQIFYEVYENDRPTLVLVPAAPITHSRSWKGLIPTLSRRYRVVTMDGRGNGRSGRPIRPEDHTRAANVEDILAVFDATRTKKGILVSHCHANWWAVDFAHSYHERVAALVMIDPGLPFVGEALPHWVDTPPNWDSVLDEPTGWDLFNRHTIVNEHRKWVEFFFGQQLVEPHSTQHHEDMVGWASESTGDVLAASEEGIEIHAPQREEFRRLLAGLGLPVLVIHGELDVCKSVTKAVEVAELAQADLLVVEGGGHLPQGRDPVVVNHAIQAFVDRVKEPA